MWPFKRKVTDRRNWNEDWRVGDTAECIVRPGRWHRDVPPWDQPAFGQQLVVEGFKDAVAGDGTRAYFLYLVGWPVGIETIAFRKVRPVSAEQSSVVEQILTAKPGQDVVREPVS